MTHGIPLHLDGSEKALAPCKHCGSWNMWQKASEIDATGVGAMTQPDTGMALDTTPPTKR